MLHLLQVQGAGLLLGVISLLLLAPSLLVAAQSNSKPGCPNQCGSLTIPYPFGLSTQEDCYLPDDDGLFTIDCNTAVEPNIPYWMNMSTNIQIKNISVVNHEMQIMVYVAYDCYNTTGQERRNRPTLKVNRFPISSTRNAFTAIGCDTEAFFQGYRDQTYAIGCLSLCYNITDVANRTCSGIGCCHASIPKNVFQYDISLRSFSNHSSVLQFNPCSYAFVAENGYFNFSIEYLGQMDEKEVPLVLDWAIGNQTCIEARQNETSYACKENTNCTDAENGTGYRCHCEEGYQGNPYLSGSGGCQDIDECETSNPCQVTSLCVNLPGKFSCSCRDGYEGDGKRNGIGCSRKTLQKNIIIRDIALGVVAALLFLLSAWWLCKRIKRRKKMKLRQKFFKQNGGLLLQQQLASPEANIEKSKLFNSEELERATNNFNENRIIGQGGQGTVYKGMLIDGRIVAIKKSKMLYKGDVEQFINEVSILSQINHRNVVKLLGCCLETEVPLLVYEFIPNGTLYQYLHEPNEEFQVPWDVRLQIASEVAGALFYLHSASSIPIYHRDIKTTNILLDEKYRAKIADFGTSRLVALDQTHVTTVVQGTFGYLDPEYFQSSQFTDKSDVYSFGVVLVELLTGQKAISSLRTQEGRGLATYFILSVEEDRLFEILDARISNRVNREEIIALANLARRCLNLNGRMRPTMKEVAMALESLRKSLHPSDVQGIEERCWNFEIDGIEAHDVSYRSAGFEAGVPMCLTMDVYPLLSSDT